LAKNNHRFLKNFPVIQGTFLVVVLSGAAMITFGICHSAKKKRDQETQNSGDRKSSRKHVFPPQKKVKDFKMVNELHLFALMLTVMTFTR